MTVMGGGSRRDDHIAAPRSEKQVLDERLDDIIELLRGSGHGSRVEIIRRAVFALPMEDEEHLSRLMQFGGLRYREANGWTWSEEAMAMLDGAEIAHPAIEKSESVRQELIAFQERARQLNPRLSPIGSSDVHMTSTIGVDRTFLFVREASVGGVLDALRNGRTVAMDSRGRLYGRPELVELVERHRPAGRSDPHPAWRGASLAMALLGGVGLLMLGRSRSPARPLS